jgi:hypothetical protein
MASTPMRQPRGYSEPFSTRSSPTGAVWDGEFSPRGFLGGGSDQSNVRDGGGLLRSSATAGAHGRGAPMTRSSHTALL